MLSLSCATGRLNPMLLSLAASGFSTSGSNATAGGRADYPTDGTNSLAAGGGGPCSYYYTDHDGTPVLTSATCTISSADLDTGSGTSSTTQHYARALGGHDGCDNDDAGHVLAHQLGGCGSCPTNIVPQSPHLNRGVWEQFEAAIRDCIDGGAGATLSWTFKYDSTSDERPSTMSYAAKYIGGSCDDASQDFDNACTDVDAR